ncbi:casein kinase family protein [Aspergillus affinis]|uniref:casein kinase family protein n=1 Tax=Aspergillus affinis TaxID=1070780 RepID=UPI0022FF3381|nr:casein kinase family protein [Aspergillus affinis]KAI9037214.1 casein kinase family protein [Aspergillus affinis]
MNEIKVSSTFPFQIVEWPNVLGSIGLGRHSITHEEVFIKEYCFSSLADEANLLNVSSGGIGIPVLHWCGSVNGKEVMVTDTYGPSLEDLFSQSGRYFSFKTLIEFADQLLARVEFIHSRKIIHGDLSPWSFAMGNPGWQSQQILLVDFATKAEANTSALDDLHAIGQILMYFYSGASSWELFQQAKDCEKDTAPAFARFHRAVRSCRKINYNMLRSIFRDAYEDLTFNLAVALDLYGPRAITYGPLSRMGSSSPGANSGCDFQSLNTELSHAGRLLEGTGPLSKSNSVELLASLDKITELYSALLHRDRAIERGGHITNSYALPNRLWRDLRWILEGTREGPACCRLAVVGKCYKFIGVLYEAIPSYRVYWVKYLLTIARIQREIEPPCSKSPWTQNMYYWQDIYDSLQS